MVEMTDHVDQRKVLLGYQGKVNGRDAWAPHRECHFLYYVDGGLTHSVVSGAGVN